MPPATVVLQAALRPLLPTRYSHPYLAQPAGLSLTRVTAATAPRTASPGGLNSSLRLLGREQLPALQKHANIPHAVMRCDHEYVFMCGHSKCKKGLRTSEPHQALLQPDLSKQKSMLYYLVPTEECGGRPGRCALLVVAWPPPGRLAG